MLPIKRSRATGRPTPRARLGFTLIELLIVVVIIGIIASVALPSFQGAQDRARNSIVVSNLHLVHVALEDYASDYNGTFPDVNLANGGGGGRRRRGGRTRQRKGAGAPLDGLEDYLDGGELPNSPWADTAQTLLLAPALGLYHAGQIASGQEQLNPEGFRVSSTGKPDDPPAYVDSFGAQIYSYGNASNVWVMYGIGKKNKSARVVAAASNMGGN